MLLIFIGWYEAGIAFKQPEYMRRCYFTMTIAIHSKDTEPQGKNHLFRYSHLIAALLWCLINPNKP